ncbi:hypothetical protein V8F20_007873 [Naviculisporaceae sp. PSN 640]
MSSYTKSIIFVLLAVTSSTAAQELNLFCVDKSYRTSPPVWTLENFQYSSRVKIGSFQLTNNQSDYSTFLYCDNGRCGRVTDDYNPLGSNVTATVNLTGGTANIAFNQTWTCVNHGVSMVFPLKYVEASNKRDQHTAANYDHNRTARNQSKIHRHRNDPNSSPMRILDRAMYFPSTILCHPRLNLCRTTATITARVRSKASRSVSPARSILPTAFTLPQDG